MTAFSAILDVDTQKYKGYSRATDTKGNPINYWYRIWGGDHHNQGVITVSKRGDGDSTLVVRFDESNSDAPNSKAPNTASTFNMLGVSFYRDPKKTTPPLPAGPGDQFDSAVAGDKRSVTIYDRIRTYDGEQVDCYHSIHVVDTAGDPKLVIVCDPTIHNVGLKGAPPFSIDNMP